YISVPSYHSDNVTFLLFFFFFFNNPPTTQIYTLSLHDALPISPMADRESYTRPFFDGMAARAEGDAVRAQSSFQLARARVKRKIDRKSTRLNSSHRTISYAVFCLKKKNNKKRPLYKQ